MANIHKQFFKDFNDLSEYYNFLIKRTKNHDYVGTSNEWLIDNYYILAEHKNNIKNALRKIKAKSKEINRNYYVLKSIVSDKNYNINFKYLIAELKKHQKENNYNFSYQEISTFIHTLTFIYIRKLSDIYQDEYNKLVDKDTVKEIIIKDNLTIADFGLDKIDIFQKSNYIFEINNQIHKIDNNSSNTIFKEVNEFLEKHNVCLKDIINDEYQNKINNNIIIANIFNNLKDFFDYSEEEMYEKISKTEQLLLKNQCYKKMTHSSKGVYRSVITKNAKKKHTTEYDYLKQIITDDEHIGFKLFKKKNVKLRIFLYLLIQNALTILLTYFLSKYFVKPQIMSFIILYIPIGQIVKQVINEVIISSVHTKIIHKLDYSTGIPEESKAMVVIPTIISTKEKIEEMFGILETFYIINKTDNLYFTLLGDTKASLQQEMEYDAEIAAYGESIAATLNEKYKKELFFFIYRKRVWNEKENLYMGYERKRGALIHFNKILLGKKIDEKKYFYINTLNNKKLGIKYVITLDTDTRLVLNSALNLVGAMAHPLNKPVLNKENTKVIKGYAIMQPRVSVDIESTNKSIYSQVFAGIGGFDTYSSIMPNVYQDCFDEGSFIGKGIYDLEVFDKIVGDTFPENLILSHDLLEGNYLRCGYVSDIELIDEFPSKFLTDTSRHHRWARGDTQIIGWLFNKVRNFNNEKVRNPITVLGKYKILDNIIRMFLNPILLIIILIASFCTPKKTLFWIFLVILEIAISIIFYLRSKMSKKAKGTKNVYYKNLFFGSKSILLRSYIVFATIPYYSKLYMDAFFRTIYRLLISHKNLLNWITAEEAEKMQNHSLTNYIKQFAFNYFVSALLIAISAVTNNYYSLIPALIFISGPFVLWHVSKTIDYNHIDIKDNKIIELQEVALKTWQYFYDNLKVEYNYLIPDNYQENREEKQDMRTSPTDIGYSLTSIISAQELNFIEIDESIKLIEKILISVDSLDKWHGHLYNWYNIKTKQVLYPNFVSTADSGNFIACLIVTKEFLKKHSSEKLVKLCEKLIKNTNFKKLYTKKDVFSIGYEESDGRLSIYNYNKFASEARLTSYIAICLNMVPNKHWLCLDKSLTTYKKYKGLISWSGTAFEYYMPLLFMKNYDNTLLDESYKFAHLCQKEFVHKISHKLPWGISESAYNELDNSLNYKYKAFSIPYLKAKEDKENRIVISPYASIMALELFPEDVLENIKKLKSLNMYSEYGFYESYDYDNNGIVKAYFAHHQGMILLGIVNYLKRDIIKEYFHSDVNIKTYELLLKEKVQVKSNIDLKMAKYKKYNYNKEVIENDIRSFDYISYLPEMSVLSNKKYSLIMNDRGNSFTRYRMLQLNRYRKFTDNDYGIFLFIKDIDTNYIWSNTYAPMNKQPEKYEVVFAADKIKYLRKDNKITTRTEIVVCKNYNAEIRKITFQNDSDKTKTLELTSYTEPILTENMHDISHKVFNSMFITTEYDFATNSLIAKRKNREDTSVHNYMLMRLLIDEPECAYSYETERVTFIGRNQSMTSAAALNNNLSNYSGDNLDPILSLRNKITLKAGDKKTVYLIIGFGRSKEQIKEIINYYDKKDMLKKEFKISTLMNIVETKNMNITGENMRTFNTMLNYLYQTSRISITEDRMDLLRKNALTQAGLWKFGISGDRPVIVVELQDVSNMNFIYEILKAFEYFKNRSVFVDIVIINNEKQHYADLVKKAIDDELYKIYALNSFYHTPGSVTVIEGKSITNEDINLLNMVARIRFSPKVHLTLKESVEHIQSSNKISNYEEIEYEKNETQIYPLKLEYDNGYGGFKENGHEYVIYNKNTPTPWSNVIANKTFGTIITNNGCGYTYGYNSSEFKISSWTNETVINDKSEGFTFNGKMFDPEVCTHGFGYTILESESEKLKHSITEFIPIKDNVKVYLIKLSNKANSRKTVTIEFWINPAFGNFGEKTARHILTEHFKNENYLKMRNVYSIDYSDVNVFMSSSEKIVAAECQKVMVKSITTTLTLSKGEEKELVFTLGCSNDMLQLESLVKKYSNVSKCYDELQIVKDNWDSVLGTIKVKTEDPSFDYMVNGWYLYQTISSRILSKAGFYQVSGAFGYRDQLQDSINIALIDPVFTKEQILKNAKHQFEEGDTLHWWHEKNHFGLRSKYKDDFLWLVYATNKYIEITGDYSILDEKTPYVSGEKLSKYESEKGIVFNYTDKEETILKHCLKSLELSMNNMGNHHLPLMGGGDWNDGMNKVGIKGKGESVWLGFFLYLIISDFVKIISHYDKNIDISKYEEFNEKLKESLNTKAWDGNYYLRAYFDNNDKLGSCENKECKIDLISQSFSILSGVAPKNRIESILASVEEQLVDKNQKLIKLLTPPFKNSLNNPGYIMSYPAGIRENGGQYTHAAAWYIMALIQTGYNDKAYKYYQMINPINRTATPDSVGKYRVEPYVIAADIYSSESFPARGGWTWYTGSAGWFYKLAIEDILGIKKRGNILTITPKIPTSWDGFDVEYRYINTTYIVNVSKGNKNKISLDGKELNENRIELVNDKEKHKIKITIKQ